MPEQLEEDTVLFLLLLYVATGRRASTASCSPKLRGKLPVSAAAYRIRQHKNPAVAADSTFSGSAGSRHPPTISPAVLSPKSACIPGPGQVRTTRPDRPILARLQPRVDSGHTCRRRRKKNSDCRFRLDSSGPHSLNRSPGESHISFERGYAGVTLGAEDLWWQLGRRMDGSSLARGAVQGSAEVFRHDAGSASTRTTRLPSISALLHQSGEPYTFGECLYVHYRPIPTDLQSDNVKPG